MKKIFLLSLLIASFVKSQTPGTQDMSFGANGTTEFITSSNPFKGFQGNGMALLPNNDFIVGGVSNWGCSATSYYTGIISKFNQNGILDTSYSQNGILNNVGVVGTMKPSNDGNYFIIDQYTRLVKMSPSGSRIASWGTSGFVNLPTDYFIKDWKETSNGEVIVTSVKRNYDNKYYSAIFKYDMNGILVTSFGTNGTIDFTANPNWLFTNVNIDNDNNLLFTGKKRTSAVYDDANIVVFKTDINGVPVTNFGSNGMLTITNYNSYYNNNTFTFITPDNGLVVSTSGSNRYLIVKILPNATLDPAFNSGFKFGSNVVNPINTFFIDNSFYVFGEFNASNFIVGKINSSGNADTAYNTNGYVIINRLPGLHNATKAMQQDNKLVIAETMDNFYCAQSNWKLVMRRFYFKAAGSLSTNENIKTNDISIYPNPADNSIFLEGLEKDIELIAADGKKIDIPTKREGKKLTLNISHLIKGTYILKGKTSDGKTVTKKFIKK
ncbi:Por secretion system C-terminal sorting domain-containing protein [Chryseobacterium oranimense]|uniref:Por secretion system C-terminal sorting domain-containing protein n=1 Tax=Chryseobacterium oranimense TaxID=421058 RepID=A0A1M5Q1Q5_9FLAO|nr:T9SS type A sorting domain-containing protein [Chryseobacterium oranimense]SHH07659.1 Por secretion system C-terminal sorting domain-containing protein [Chryseobacterium oranimense]